MDFITLFLLFGGLLHEMVSSHPTYVPNSPDVCSKMIPGHGPRPQNTPPPYEIILNKQSVMGGNNLQIVIHAHKGKKFRGFYMQVRDIDGIPIGSFLSPDDKESGTHNCFNRKNNAIHHKNRNDKESITVYWKAPEDHEGNVRVVATILKEFETYWTNVLAPEAVSVSNIRDNVFVASPAFPEKTEKESPKHPPTNRILNYNPYSPFSPLSSWETQHNSSSEFLLPQSSDKSSIAAGQRQLLGPVNFDFHGGLYSSKLSPLSSKVLLPGGHTHRHHGRFSAHPNSINEQLPPLPHHNRIVAPLHPHSPSGSLFHKLGSGKSEIREQNYFYPKKPLIAVDRPPSENPYLSGSLNEIQNNPAYFTPSKLEQSYIYPPSNPHYSQMVHDKNGHHIINHHFTPSTIPDPVYSNPYTSPKYHGHKPSSDPSYPNSGYFPKDILTKLTSYIPNIYNAITNNPLFNFNVDNTIESIWKPSRGVPQQQNWYASSAATPSKVEMPKYGYLIYNPVRGNPFYVIPAQNEDEFIANHMHHSRKTK